MKDTPPTLSLFRACSVLLTSLFLLVGCQHDFLQDDSLLSGDNTPLGQAQSWYRKTQGREEVLLSTPGTRSGDAPLFFTEPGWKYVCPE